TTAAPRPASRNFTLNFTLTNLRYTADLDAPNSRKFKSTVKVMNHYVSLALLVPLLGHAVSQRRCLTFFPRSGKSRDETKVDAVCSYKDSASLARFDRAKLHQELSTMTSNVTQLGHYSLGRNSLYVDG
ncbi:MUC16 protein, partial [Mystacornis crossleyi]|nr:MUC16 protein [Mystacornis crossleyi]